MYAAPAGAEQGSGFTDRVSGLCFEAHHPARRPDLWRAYLDGAEACYRSYGVESVLSRPALEGGGTTSLFWIAMHEGRAMAGIRCHGPFTSSHQAHALWELRTHPQLPRIRQMLDDFVPRGLVEIKGAWVTVESSETRGLSSALARCCIHSMSWFGARYGICTTAAHSAPRWSSTGGRTVEGLESVAYPDERYQTVLLTWDHRRLPWTASADELATLKGEWAEVVSRRPFVGGRRRPVLRPVPALEASM